MKIMICDDDSIYGTLMTEVLKEKGYEVKYYQDSILAKQQARKEYFDLILTDYEMPRLKGDGLIESIKKTKINGLTPSIIMSSGIECLDYIKPSKEIGYIRKPINIFDLECMINNILEGIM